MNYQAEKIIKTVSGALIWLALVFSLTLSAAALPTSLVVSWSIPTTYVDGVALPESEITGFDVYLVKDGSTTYAKWSAGTTAEYKHPVAGPGEYCFYLVTVTKDNGKSDNSETVCHTVTEQPTTTNAKPSPPTAIIITAE